MSGGPLIERQPVERAPDLLGCFLAGQRPIGEHRPARLELAALLQVLVERHLAGAVAPPPPALPVARLVDDDAIDPGAEGRLAPEARQGPEDPEEDLLGQVQRFVAVPQQVQGQRENHALVLGDELGARRLVPRRAALMRAASRLSTSDQLRVPAFFTAFPVKRFP